MIFLCEIKHEIHSGFDTFLDIVTKVGTKIS
ncbi:MAG: hypothetical protein ACI8YQ_002227 [Polaribacter sp.]|jgi:hypothetical protein